MALLACACFASTGVAASKLPPPPPPPVDSVAIDFTLAVEFPDGRKLATRVDHGADCASQKFCGEDYYGIAGAMEVGFRKLGLVIRQTCQGLRGERACHVTEIGGVANSPKGSWVMFRNGHRNRYPYNQITRGMEPQRVVYRFLSSSKARP